MLTNYIVSALIVFGTVFGAFKTMQSVFVTADQIKTVYISIHGIQASSVVVARD